MSGDEVPAAGAEAADGVDAAEDPAVEGGRAGRRFGGVDVLVQGEGIRRGVSVEVDARTVRVGDLQVPCREIYWTSRRAGLLMLFARDRTLAVKGDRPTLEAVARAVEARRGDRGGRGQLPVEMAEEVVVCTAGTAVVGRVGGRKTSGLRVAVFTRRALHLLAGDREVRLGWPVQEVRVVEEAGGQSGDRALLLRKDEDVLRLLYLFPEEMEAAARVARSAPDVDPGPDGVRRIELPDPPGPAPDGSRDADAPADDSPAPAPDAEAAAPDAGEEDPAADADEPPPADVDDASDDAPEPPPGRDPLEPPPDADGGDPAPGADGDPGRGADGEELEMFDRREVAGPVRPELPEFRLSVEVLQSGAQEAAVRFPDRQTEQAGLAPHFLETHFLELGETALGPLLLRKSAASTARTLKRAVEAMDASGLQEDTEAAASNAADRLIEVYGRELDRLLSEKRAPARVEEEQELDVEEREDVRLRIHAPFEKLVPLFRDLESKQEELRRRVRDLEEGPPDADDGEVREAARAWRRSLARVDRGFVDAWDELVREIAEVWEERLLPGLAEVGAMRRRRMPEWMLLVLLALATLLAAAGVMLFLVE